MRRAFGWIWLALVVGSCALAVVAVSVFQQVRALRDEPDRSAGRVAERVEDVPGRHGAVPPSPAAGRLVELERNVIAGSLALAGLLAVALIGLMLSTRRDRGDQKALREARERLEQRANERTAELRAEIADRQRAERSLSDSETRFRDLVEGTDDLVTQVDGEGRFIYVNHASEVVFGLPPEKCIGRLAFEFIHPEDRERTREAFADWIREPPHAATFENRQVSLSGEVRHLLWTISVHFDEQGRPAQITSIGNDITDRKSAEEALREAKEAAEAGSRAKSEFLANMSHEIRTPMNGILGMTELALGTELTAEQQEYLQFVRVSARGLLNIINDMLDFSRIEAGKLRLDAVAFNLHDCVRETIGPLTVQARQKKLSLGCRVQPDVPAVLVGDPGRVRQILINLIGNAIKFTDTGGVRVGIDLERRTDEKAHLHVEVNDTGIGIDPAKQRDIFSAFEQADGSTTRKHGGTGLGLAICSQLVGLMGGRIWVESAPGAGSTFHFTIRLGLTTAGAQVAPAAAEKQPPPDGASDRRLRVLVAEDNPINKRLTVRLLEKAGHTALIATDGKQALQLLERQAFDLILMDLQMPEMGGLEATALIRRRERETGRHVRIVALTAHALKSDRQRCLDAGMDDYLSKPVSPADLRRVVDAAARPERHTPRPQSAPEPAPQGPPGAPPDAAPDAEACPVDLTKALAAAGNSVDLLQEIVAVLLEELPKQVEQVAAAVRDADASALRDAAHKLKGAVGAIHAERALQLARDLEHMGRDNRLLLTHDALRSLSEETHRVCEHLRSTHWEQFSADRTD